MPFTADQVREIGRKTLGGRPLVIVSNREPYIHTFQGTRVHVRRPASGLTVALDSVASATGGLWVAHGSGDADRKSSDCRGRVPVPPESPAYTLKRVWLTKEQEEGYYYGFANSALWPLCHIAYRRPDFRRYDWERYREVNALFAEAVAGEIGQEKAYVFVQDYHLALLPRMLKQRAPHAVIAQFWHIPWPNPEVFRICPWDAELLEGLLGNDLLGFHVRFHVLNFLETVDRELESRIDHETTAIVHRGSRTVVRDFPISVDFEAIARDAASERVAACQRQLRRQLRLPPDNIGIGVDRSDYTKGIPERLRAIDRFLDLHPEYRQNFVFVQVAVPSRTRVEQYRRLNEEIDSLVEEINWKHGDDTWKPLRLIKEHVERLDLLALYGLARFAVVSSLQDGMNLVAKEFVAARNDETAVLLLSEFTGAAKELTDALRINPYATDHLADQIHRALTLPEKEARARMRRMRKIVADRNIYRWAAEILRKLGELT